MISIINYHKRFNAGTINAVYALRGIDLHVNPGDFITIIGTNGSGKSTLLNAIAGTFLPDDGRISIAGEDLTFKKDFYRAKYISRVFQNPFMGTAPEMTIAENLHTAFLRGRRRFPKLGLNTLQLNTYKEAVKQLEMQLEERLDNLIGSLSGGQRQALTLLMSVMTKPEVLLLDEHTAALDPKSAAQIARMTQKFIERDQLTAMMVTHSMQQALDLGSRLIMMNQGQIIEDLPLSEKNHLTVDDLLDKFAELRKKEKLTDEMLDALRREYI